MIRTEKILNLILMRMVGKKRGEETVTGIEISSQFHPERTSPEDTLKNVNAAFLICLCGASHSRYLEAKNYMQDMGKNPSWRNVLEFYEGGSSVILDEMDKCWKKDGDFRDNLLQLENWLSGERWRSEKMETVNKVWRVFFPEGVSLFENRERAVESLRRARAIQIKHLNANPITEPAAEILFTSNVLLTIPSSIQSIEQLDLDDLLKNRMIEVAEQEKQSYWYDHPIQMGVEKEGNEVIYGLKALDKAIAFEKKRGVIPGDVKMCCVLSVSVTHQSIHHLARNYLKKVLKTSGLNHLQIYVFTEADSQKMIRMILTPALARYMGIKDAFMLKTIFGVDGEYGRHYSFLKAIAAYWHVLLDRRIKGTFKIDLDQVFPQEALVQHTGASALEHLKTPLWGAEGKDTENRSVSLGMIAGALVNQKDIERSLFTPDVPFPTREIHGDEWIFFSSLPQALSTEAEMMMKHHDIGKAGRNLFCSQRFHVTGGTCGILVKALRSYRPFTPTFIGRAEDQAYLLSVLFKKSEGMLRYLHKDGLIMRHDKEGFAREAIERANTGKLVGDYTRTLLFSYYARALPWPVEKIKNLIDPFTGCFVSRMPKTIVHLRLSLKAASLFQEGKSEEAFDLVQLGAKRLSKIIRRLSREPHSLRKSFEEERRSWGYFYDLLDRIEMALDGEESFAVGLRKEAVRIMAECRIL